MTMTCWETVQAYAFRSIGYGENLLPKTDFTLCQHFTLIGSGMIWNVYFGALALALGFFFANALALAKAPVSSPSLSGMWQRRMASTTGEPWQGN
jgi:polar amino acid transport system permease protein